MFSNLRHAVRTLVAMPVLTTVVVLSLGIGIGVNTTVFSWLQMVTLQPFPGVPRSSQFHFVEPRAETGSYPGASWLEYLDLRERMPALADPMAFRMVPLNVGETARTERTFAQLVSANFFSALGLRPALGRFLRTDEVQKPGGEPVVVISYDYWQTRFGGSPSALGQAIRANDRLLTIVGVAPARFQGTVLSLNFDLWVPATMAPVLLGGSRELEDRTLRGYTVMSLLQPDATERQAQTELDRAMSELARLYPATNATMKGSVLTFWQAVRGPQRMLAQALLILQGIMLILLLAVCGNTANLVLARASVRHREIGVRLALGAGPRQVIGLLITESVLLGLLGAALGTALAMWGTEALRAVPIVTAFPIRFQTSVDAIGLAFAAALGVGSGVLFGLAPAIQLSRVDPQAALRAGARAAGRSVMRSALMAIEVALALVVLMAAGLFLRSFSEAREIDPGFRKEGVLLAAYDLFGRNLDSVAARTFAARLLDRVRALPAVESAAIASSVPLDIHGLPMHSFTLEGRARSDGRPDQALSNIVTAGYFKTMDIPFRAGGDFVELADATAPPQAIVNEEFVRRFVDSGGSTADEAALGRGLQIRGGKYAIVGVVRNSISDAFGETATPVVYLSFRDRTPQAGELHVRTRPGAESLLVPELQRIVRELEPSLPLYDARTLSEHVEKNLFLRRIPARMFVVLGPLLLILAAIGIYGVVDFSVSRRTTEIGVRLALGATARTVVGQIVRETIGVVLAGAMVGWTMVVMVALHLVRGPMYPSVYIGVPALLLTVATVACWIPARRAARLDPVEALRQD